VPPPPRDKPLSSDANRLANETRRGQLVTHGTHATGRDGPTPPELDKGEAVLRLRRRLTIS
jgi:hypothetical protein